ncbi:MAG: hypothetical protein Q4D22_01700 [Candidatus Saccharibacteria bacterium]|nr:hypothetical protein [Candidatus Saccharibacteria bacterium]
MGYSEEQKREILSKTLRIVISLAKKVGKTGFAPDILIESTMRQAQEFIEKYQDQPDIDIWRNARLDYYTQHLVRKLIIENLYDYELSEENFEAVDALIEAEEMLGDHDSDEELEELFDYTPEELTRLRIIAKYFDGIDREAVYREFSKKYGL